MKRLTDKEVHDGLLVEIFDHLKSAQAALDAGDVEVLGDALCEAGFSVCCLLPDACLESAPGAWFEGGVA